MNLEHEDAAWKAETGQDASHDRRVAGISELPLLHRPRRVEAWLGSIPAALLSEAIGARRR